MISIEEFIRQVKEDIDGFEDNLSGIERNATKYFIEWWNEFSDFMEIETENAGYDYPDDEELPVPIPVSALEEEKEPIEIPSDNLVDIEIINDSDTSWHVLYKGQHFYHPTPEQSGAKLKYFAKENGGFFLGMGPFCLMTGADATGKFDEAAEKIKQTSGCNYFTKGTKDGSKTFELGILLFSIKEFNNE